MEVTAPEEILSVSNDESTSSPSGLEPGSAVTVENSAPTSTACISCREKHLKCDGLPTCTRCAALDLACVYLKSRRGCRSARSTRVPRASGAVNAKQVASSRSSDADMTPSELLETNILSLAFVPLAAKGGDSSSPEFPLEAERIIRDGARQLSPLHSHLFRPSHIQRCMEAFYQYFYHAHPFLPPRRHFLQALKQTSMQHLQMAMCFVGSRYVTGAPMSSFAFEFESYLSGTKAAPRDASMVQAMLLYALGLTGNNERKRAVEILIKAQNQAIELGMNQQEYAVLNGRGSTVGEESLRRTWWELYVVSIMVAGFQGSETFHCWDSMSNVHLPCEENEYASGFIPRLQTLEQFDEESFDSEDMMFSSHTYRIAAARNLDRILQSTQIVFPDDPALCRLENHLTNWRLHLSEKKKHLFDQSGAFDEILFQAHLIVELSTLILYRHFSPIDSLAARTITSCTPESAIPCTSFTDSIHTRRATLAASNISKLATVPESLMKHTHFFICALTLSSITHLSVWATLGILVPDQDLKQQIRINIGALKAVAPLWPAARISLQQVMSVAQRIYKNRKDAVGEVFWGDFIDDDLMTGLIGNETSLET